MHLAAPVLLAAVVLVAFVAPAGLVSGCNPQANGSADASASPDAPAAPPGAAAGAAVQPDTQRLESSVVFTRSGGFVGYDDRIEVSPGGTLRISTAGREQPTKQLPADSIAELARLLEASGLFTEDRTYETVGADLVRYSVEYRGVAVVADEGQLLESMLPLREWMVSRLGEPGQARS